VTPSFAKATEGKKLRVAIVDDEMPARQILREYLDGDAQVEIVAECANGFEAVKAVTDQRPDVLLLDVQMPKLDGFEVLELVGRDTAVIFTTAYDEYALRAFDVHAIDYLLKPFSRERLQEALTRARSRLARGASPAPPADLAGAARPPGAWLARIVIRDGAEVHVVPIDKIDYVEAQDDYIAVRVGERALLKEQTLADLEKQLDPRRFVRIHRSFLLNLDRLARLEPSGKDSRMAVLRDGRRLPVSRSGYARLQELL
jgi:two-component system LytT family response regulator